MLICPKCGSTYEEGTKRFCPNEGSRLLTSYQPNLSKNADNSGVFNSLLINSKKNNKSEEAYQEALKRIEENFRTKATNLDLSDLNDLTKIPPEIGKLTHLLEVDFGNNDRHTNIITIPKEFYNLTQLQFISFSFTKINEIDLEVFLQLKYISLHKTFVDKVNLANLIQLRELYLGLTNITDLNLTDLFKLEKLYIFNTRISEINLKNLSQLQTINLNGTQISEINLDNQTQLQSLNLSNTQISEINLDNQTQLQSLNLSNTQISEINLDNQTQLQYLDLRGTNIDLPNDVLEQWENAQYIIKYYNENVKDKKAADLRPLNEVKMLLVGQGRVGKTSLVKYLVKGKICDPDEPTTHGILREKWRVDVINQDNHEKHNIQLNIWDFGGQDIMKSTHQFFLTDKSLYLLVLDAGRDKAGNKLNYWLEKIKSVSEDAPIIIVANKSEDNVLDLPVTDLKEKYNIRGIFHVSCKDGRQIYELQQSIKNEIGNMSSVFEKINKNWFAVKEYLENLKEDYISKDEYRKICRDNKVTDSESQKTLLKRLNDLGIMLNFKEHETEVLNPEWVTRGVYKVVTSAEVMKNKGILTSNLLKSELESLNDELRREKKDYLCYPPEKQNFITDLMKQFELTYQISDTENFLIPALLPEDYTLDEDWNEKECFRFRYFYESVLLDEGIISRFIVKTQHLSHNQKHWLTGCLLKNDKKNLALIKADVPNKTIDIWVKGNSRTKREFLGIIKAYFESIHQDKKPTELIPFFVYENEFVNYKDLIVLELSGEYETVKVVKGEAVKYDIRDLLNGYSTREERFKEHSLENIKQHDVEIEDLRKQGKLTKKQNAKEIDDIVEPYLNDEKLVKKEQEKPSLIKIFATFAFLFIVILASIGFYDYLQKQGYLSEKGFYFALIFTVVFIVVIGTFSLVYLGIIPPDKIPDILKPAFGLITGNQETKELNPKSENKIETEKKEPEKQLNS